MYTKLLVVWVLEQYPWLSILLQSSILKWPTALCENHYQGYVSLCHLPQSDTATGKLNWLWNTELTMTWTGLCRKWQTEHLPNIESVRQRLCYIIFITHAVMCIIHKSLYCCLCTYHWLTDYGLCLSNTVDELLYYC